MPSSDIPGQQEPAEQPKLAQRLGSEMVVGCFLIASSALAVVLHMARRNTRYSAVKRQDPADDEAEGMLVPIDRVLDDDLVEHHLQPLSEDSNQRAISGDGVTQDFYRF